MLALKQKSDFDVAFETAACFELLKQNRFSEMLAKIENIVLKNIPPLQLGLLVLKFKPQACICSHLRIPLKLLTAHCTHTDS